MHTSVARFGLKIFSPNFGIYYVDTSNTSIKIVSSAKYSLLGLCHSISLEVFVDFDPVLFYWGKWNKCFFFPRYISQIAVPPHLCSLTAFKLQVRQKCLQITVSYIVKPSGCKYIYFLGIYFLQQNTIPTWWKAYAKSSKHYRINSCSSKIPLKFIDKF